MAQTEAPLPSKIGRHQVVGYIATGGMAELFLGKEQTGRPIVIKRILPHLARQPAFVSMFVDEARIGTLTKHPNLVEVLDNIAHTVRERFKFQGKLRAITTETRLSGYVLGALPFVCGLAIALFNPEYLQPLYSDSIGRAIVVIGLGLWALGGYWMRRLSQVDY